MIFYFAATDGGKRGSVVAALRAEGAEHVLIAYPAILADRRLLEERRGFKLFLDCGAWSVATGAVPPIDVREFIAWLRAQGDGAFHLVAALDVIGDPVATRRNWLMMRDAGLDVLPTWHAGEPLALASEYAEVSEYVAVGGLAGGTVDVPSVVGGVWDRIKHRRTHLFGVAALNRIASFRPTSTDCTAWRLIGSVGKVYTMTTWPTLSIVACNPTSTAYRRAAALGILEEMHRYGSSWTALIGSYQERNRYNIRLMLDYVRRLSAVAERTP